MADNYLDNLNKKIYSIDELKDDITTPRNILILSRSGSGKSVLIKNLISMLLKNHDFNCIILYSKTARYETEYDFINEDCKYDGDLDELITNILNYQKKNLNNNLLFLLDDLDVTKKSDMLSDLFTKSRHFRITILLSSQYVKTLVSSTIRSNFHYLFFNQLNFENLECIYKIVYIDIDKKSFFNFIYNIKEKYAFFFYDNTGKQLNESYKLVRADIINFKIKI